MRILVVVPTYPYAAHKFAGVFNERCVTALKAHCEVVEVLAPRPFVPSWISRLSSVPRWQAYATLNDYEVRDGVAIHRPAYMLIPRFASEFWVGPGAFVACRRKVRELHKQIGFDVILSFDLVEAGNLAWRLGRDLGIPAGGWAAGERIPLRTVQRLDLVFYQSRELFETAAAVLGVTPESMPKDKHVVLPRGIPEPPARAKSETRKRVRAAWGIGDDEVLVLSVTRITRDKGIFDLWAAIASARAKDARISCVVVGSKPGFDETGAAQRALADNPALRDRVKLLPACSPNEVWDCLCAADMFAFTSHKEGMPNAVLEAMAMGVPVVAFGIPPVREIEAGRGGLVAVPPFDSMRLGEEILRLAASPGERARIGKQGRAEIMERFMVRTNMAAAFQRLAQMLRRGLVSERHRYPSGVEAE
jgi:glycosyltransferase involved in cell wall biosynthesis